MDYRAYYSIQLHSTSNNYVVTVHTANQGHDPFYYLSSYLRYMARNHILHDTSYMNLLPSKFQLVIL